MLTKHYCYGSAIEDMQLRWYVLYVLKKDIQCMNKKFSFTC